MCNYSEGVYHDGLEKGIKEGIEKGIEKGIKEGIEKGIAGAVAILKSMGEPPEKIVERIAHQYGLSQESATQYVQDTKI